MKFTIISILALVAVAFAATMPQKAVIISYPDNTPTSVIDDAMAAIKAAGGIITHEYRLIKGFAAKAPAKALEAVQIAGNDWHAVIEEDQMVSVNGGL
ncbi:hypothetical protein IFR04_015386 [Cadophora malorum]|uniref:Proteinase inhibitor, propeptide n=1 Tax=Cadophora malorum TaxID=108018 RepID=A0A8H7T1W2_9HELO|nr:hypothetical protein IFR04_015386 [Cadophora malorum]